MENSAEPVPARPHTQTKIEASSSHGDTWWPQVITAEEAMGPPESDQWACGAVRSCQRPHECGQAPMECREPKREEVCGSAPMECRELRLEEVGEQGIPEPNGIGRAPASEREQKERAEKSTRGVTTPVGPKRVTSAAGEGEGRRRRISGGKTPVGGGERHKHLQHMFRGRPKKFVKAITRVKFKSETPSLQLKLIQSKEGWKGTIPVRERYQEDKGGVHATGRGLVKDEGIETVLQKEREKSDTLERRSYGMIPSWPNLME